MKYDAILILFEVALLYKKKLSIKAIFLLCQLVFSNAKTPTDYIFIVIFHSYLLSANTPGSLCF